MPRTVLPSALLAGLMTVSLRADPAQAAWPWTRDAAPSVSQAQRQPAQPRPAAPDGELRTTIAFLDVAKELQRSCENAAWSLFWSNDYEKWRNRKSRSFSMNHSARLLRGLPPAPPGLDPALSAEMAQTMAKANNLVQDGATVFRDMANYINAKDYQDDKFKKGDALNARLLEIGKTCHELSNTLRAQYRAGAQQVIEGALAKGGVPPVVRTMFQDWQVAQRLSDALGGYMSADLGAVERYAAEVTVLAEKRQNEMKLGVSAQGSSVTSFYNNLNTDIAVETRKTLREVKRNIETEKDKGADRPRSKYNTLRNEIDMQLPDDILRSLRSGTS